MSEESIEKSGVSLPVEGFVRLRKVLMVIPVGKTCWWEGVKSGRYPQPVKLSERCTGWRVEEIRELMREISKRGKPLNTPVKE